MLGNRNSSKTFGAPRSPPPAVNTSRVSFTAQCGQCVGIVIHLSNPCLSVNHCVCEEGELEKVRVHAQFVVYSYTRLRLLYICNVSDCKDDLNIFMAVIVLTL